MSPIRVRLEAALAIAVITGAAAYAAGRATSAPAALTSEPAAREIAAPSPAADLPPGHPTVGSDLPAGHPPIDTPPSAGGSMFEGEGTTPPATSGEAVVANPSLTWRVPSRWQTLPNANSMRLATYRVPRAPGDSADADVSVSQAGGAVGANIERWLGQFDDEGRRHATRTTKKVGSLEITVLSVEGTYSGGMEDKRQPGWALLGAIVAPTPGGMAHFFKITGPQETVRSAKRELEELLQSLRAPDGGPRTP